MVVDSQHATSFIISKSFTSVLKAHRLSRGGVLWPRAIKSAVGGSMKKAAVDFFPSVSYSVETIFFFSTRICVHLARALGEAGMRKVGNRDWEWGRALTRLFQTSFFAWLFFLRGAALHSVPAGPFFIFFAFIVSALFLREGVPVLRAWEERCCGHGFSVVCVEDLYAIGVAMW
jgi:hypothetical protein